MGKEKNITKGLPHAIQFSFIPLDFTQYFPSSFLFTFIICPFLSIPILSCSKERFFQDSFGILLAVAPQWTNMTIKSNRDKNGGKGERKESSGRTKDVEFRIQPIFKIPQRCLWVLQDSSMVLLHSCSISDVSND